MKTNSKTKTETTFCPDEIIVCMKDVSVVFGNIAALFEINLDIERGDFIGICGPNGSGKTTLLKTIMGVQETLVGEIRLFGEKVDDRLSKETRFKIGYVPQRVEFDRNFPALVKDIVEMGRYAKAGLIRPLTKEDKAKAFDALRLVEMDFAANRPIGHLSGGQQQRVLIAQALASEAEVLLLDEFTSALDFKMTEEVMELLDYLNKSHKITIVTIGHNIELLKAYCTRIICLNRIIVFDGKPNEPELDVAVGKIFH